MIKLKAHFMDFEPGIPVVIMNAEDAHELGLRPYDRVEITYKETTKTAYIETTHTLVNKGEIGLRKESKKYGIKEGTIISIRPACKPESLDIIKKKMDCIELKKEEIEILIKDIDCNRLTDIELGALVAAIYMQGFSEKEIINVTKSMVKHGKQMEWPQKYVVDKHSIGGIPGNRTTPIVVPILAAAGLTVPKTSSRAITSPAGTADTMEVFCEVSFTPEEITHIVNKTNACMVWGGSLDIAPVDDKLIRAEYPLSLDPEGQVIASVLSKKKSAGSKYVLIDIPLGDGAKVSRIDKARNLGRKFKYIGKKLDMVVECAITKGDGPVGRGIGPVLEAIDILEVLEGKGPKDLREKSIELAGIILKMTGQGDEEKARQILDSGQALKKFNEIITAQKGDPKKDINKLIGKYKQSICAETSGTVQTISNTSVAKIARLAGAPKDKGAGIYLYFKKDQKVNIGEKLFDIYAEEKHKLKRALNEEKHRKVYIIRPKEDMLIEEI
ncbi:MAG: AMP phosphorylase [archaeon]